MAAPLTKRIFACFVYRKANPFANNIIPVRFKYWEIGEDSLYEKGESRSDRYVGVPKEKKPHPETPIKGQYEVTPVKGKVYDKKPFPASLTAGKKYKWCSCGHSKHQPFCDGNHKWIYERLKGKDVKFDHVLHSPVTFEVQKDGQYWLCNCKQTENRPFCDGTHKQEDIQSKIK